MKWDRNLDLVETITLQALRDKHYTSVTKKHIIHFKEIYDFISRFADSSYGGNTRLRMTTGDIPPKTRAIVNTIGVENLYKYFSPQAYPTKFFRFCEKLIRTGRISSHDYICDGLIIATIYEVQEEYYQEGGR